MPITVPLSKKINTHNGEVDKIELREMNATDIVSARYPPVRVIEKRGDDDMHMEFRYDIIMQLASRLSGIDDILLGDLNAKDFHAVSNAVVKLWNASGE